MASTHVLSKYVTWRLPSSVRVPAGVRAVSTQRAHAPSGSVGAPLPAEQPRPPEQSACWRQLRQVLAPSGPAQNGAPLEHSESSAHALGQFPQSAQSAHIPSARTWPEAGSQLQWQCPLSASGEELSVMLAEHCPALQKGVFAGQCDDSAQLHEDVAQFLHFPLFPVCSQCG